jgi:nucleoid-associated protein YgaU
MWESIGGVSVRVRQDATVSVMQYIDEDRVAFKGLRPGTKLSNGQSSLGWPKKYTAKEGDTLQKVAAKFYGDASKWHRIADANGIRDPKAIKKGRVLTIPAP